MTSDASAKKTSSSKRTRRKSTAKKAPAKSRAAAKKADELADALQALHEWEALGGPHRTGLGQWQLWVTAFSSGVLEIKSKPSGDACGRITH